MQDQKTKIARLRNHIKFRHPELYPFVSIYVSPLTPEFLTIELPLHYGYHRQVILDIKRAFGYIAFRDVEQQYSKFHLY